MPAKSKSQQRFFGMVDAYKKGKLKHPSKAIKKAAKGMSKSEVEDFASTKHKGLPEVVENVIRITEDDIRKMVRESVNRLIREVYRDMDFDSYVDDEELEDELSAAGATGQATPEEIEGWTEDLWININKTFQNANYLFNKTRDEKFANIAEVIGNALELFPDGSEGRYMQIDYDPEAGYGG